MLSEVKYEDERHRFTFFEMLAEFGGFNDGLILIAKAVTGSYSYLMFLGHFSSTFPVRTRKRKRQQDQSLRETQSKLNVGLDVSIAPAQAKSLSMDLQQSIISSMKVTFFKVLHFGLPCANKRDKSYSLMA